MSRKKSSICSLLQKRELGIVTTYESQQIRDISTYISDRHLVHYNKIRTIPYIDDHSRSSYVAVTNLKGTAAMSHSNRCISLIEMGTMTRTAEINGLTRTVWTLAFHPTQPDLLATGDLGGRVCVFGGATLIRCKSNDNNHPITSISFHSIEGLLFYSIDNRVCIWNYLDDNVVCNIYESDETRIKYVKYNPTTAMLITGIRREDNIAENMFGLRAVHNENIGLPLVSCTAFFTELLNALAIIIHSIDPAMTVDLWTIWPNIKMQIVRYYNRLKYGNFSEHLCPLKALTDVDRSLEMLRCRLHQIARTLFTIDSFSNAEILNGNVDSGLYPIRETLVAIQYILKVYESEVMPFQVDTKISYTKLSDIIVSINRIVFHRDVQHLIQQNIRKVEPYRLQAWDMDILDGPDFTENFRNILTCCYIHNDSTVALSKCGTMIGSYVVARTEKIISVHSLIKSNLGQHICTYGMDSEEILMSLSFAPSSAFLLAGIRSSRIFGCFLRINMNEDLKGIRENVETMRLPTPIWIDSKEDAEPSEDIVMLKQQSTTPDMISYLKWSARPGDGIVIGYKTYQLRCLVRR